MKFTLQYIATVLPIISGNAIGVCKETLFKGILWGIVGAIGTSIIFLFFIIKNKRIKKNLKQQN